jgi:hypothetical protein
MSRPRYRACLQDGQRLDINQLMRDGAMPRDLNGAKAGTLSVRYPEIGFEQEVTFVSRPRHFGGRQFFFECPATGRRCYVLWKPPGATRFCCRQAWGRHRLGYATQFDETTARAHRAKAKICRQLGASNPWDDDFPPKPKRMRWKTYERWRERYEAQQKRLDDALLNVWATKYAHLKDILQPTDFDSNSFSAREFRDQYARTREGDATPIWCLAW